MAISGGDIVAISGGISIAAVIWDKRYARPVCRGSYPRSVEERQVMSFILEPRMTEFDAILSTRSGGDQDRRFEAWNRISQEMRVDPQLRPTNTHRSRCGGDARSSPFSERGRGTPASYPGQR